MEIQGKLIQVMEEIRVKDTFSKREFIVEYVTNPDYPQYIKFECTNDKTKIIENFKKGDAVTVKFDLQGRAWTNPKGEVVYFNTLRAFAVIGNDEEKEPPLFEVQGNDVVTEESDDLVF